MAVHLKEHLGDPYQLIKSWKISREHVTVTRHLHLSGHRSLVNPLAINDKPVHGSRIVVAVI